MPLEPADPFGPQQTDDPVYADERNFYKVERWSADDTHVEAMLYAGNRIEHARAIFAGEIARRPGGRYMIRRRARILEKWPAG